MSRAVGAVEKIARTDSSKSLWNYANSKFTIEFRITEI